MNTSRTSGLIAAALRLYGFSDCIEYRTTFVFLFTVLWCYDDSDYDDDDVNDDLQRTDATGKGECLRFTETIFNINLTAVIETDWYCSLNS